MKRFLTGLLIVAGTTLTGCTASQVPGYIGDPNAVLSPQEQIWNAQNFLQGVDRFGETWGRLGEDW